MVNDDYGKTIKKFDAIIKSSPDLSAEEEIDLIVAGRLGVIEAKERLFNSFLKLVFKAAKQYNLSNIQFKDLVQQGVLGLETAFRTFDLQMGYRFSTHARWWIIEKIKKYIRSNVRSFDVPTGASTKIFAINNSIERLNKKLHHVPTNIEISDDLKIPENKIAFYRKFLNPSVSINKIISNENENIGQSIELGDLLVDDRNNGREALIRNDGIVKIREAIDKLSDVQRYVIEQRYGLKGREELTLKKVGQKLKLTTERIRQIQNQAEKKLKLLINK